MDKRILGITLCLILLRGAVGCVAVQESARESPRYTLPPVAERPPATRSETIPGFSRGLNLGNALDAPSEGEWGVVLSEERFRQVARAGFDHVRLTVRFSAHALEKPPYTVDEAFFQRVDWAIQQALLNNLSVLLDIHHYEDLMKRPDAHAERFVALWQQIAKRYQKLPERVAFEPLNEPCDQLTSERWNPLLARAIEVIRKDNPNRLIFVDSTFWSSAARLAELVLPPLDRDANIVVTFHMYQPILFTHQGADWMPAEFHTRGILFPGPPARPVEPTAAARGVSWTREWFERYNAFPVEKNPSGWTTVAEEFAHVDEIRKTGRRVYLGEFAAIDLADPISRAGFVRIVREEAERRNLGWAYWDDGGRFKLLDADSGQMLESLRKALFD